jgi:tRNA (cmo5U34)-methyltransferase
MSTLTNKTGDGIQANRAEWEFNAEVAKTFDTHVSKSVPFYTETHQLAIDISDWFVHDGCRVVDLGCSTGTLIGDLVRRHVKKQIEFTGIDNSSAMIEQARNNLNGYQRVRLINQDLLKTEFEEDISMMYSLYTLQFVDAQHRLDLCRRIHQSLARRGAFVLIEKVLDTDSIVADIFTHLHWSKKAESGFDVTEVYAKAQALRGVLVPFTVEENFQMLKEAGFSRISTFWKWCNWIGIVAVK